MDHQPRAIFIQSHLGLGDMILANAIFRHYGETNGVITPCKFHNAPSVGWMLRGADVALLGVNDDQGAEKLCKTAANRTKVLKLGMFGKNFDPKRWDQCLFEQAGIPFEKRWIEWKVERDLSLEFEPFAEPYVLVHDDGRRGFVIDPIHLPGNLRIFHVLHRRTENIFNYCRLIENATEIHCIDSCFAILADSLTTLKAKRFVIHQYSRPNGLMPTYRFPVEILR